MFFCADKREEVKTENPELKVSRTGVCSSPSRVAIQMRSQPVTVAGHINARRCLPVIC